MPFGEVWQTLAGKFPKANRSTSEEYEVVVESSLKAAVNWPTGSLGPDLRLTSKEWIPDKGRSVFCVSR